MPARPCSGLIWGGVVLAVAPSFFWWLTPVVAGLAVAVPLSVLSSRLDIGLWLKRHGLFLTPEETRTPAELRRLRRAVNRGGWVRSTTAPDANARYTPDEAGLPMSQAQWPEKRPAAEEEAQAIG
jgi:membrane glycosyltransferase